jgi:hypothetical protein
MAKKSKGFDEWWMPLGEFAVSTTSPLLGAGLSATRIVANNGSSRRTRSDAGGLYWILLGLGGLALLAILNPPQNPNV